MMIDDVNRATRAFNNKVKQMKAENKTYSDLTTEERDALKQSEAEMYNIRAEYSSSTKKLKATEATLIEEVEAEKNSKIEANAAKAEQKQNEREKRKADKIAAAEKKAAELIANLKSNSDKALSILDYEIKMAQLKEDERLAGQVLTDEEVLANKQKTAEQTYSNEMAQQKILLDNKQITQAAYDESEKMALQQKNTDIAIINADFAATQTEAKNAALAIELQAGRDLKSLSIDLEFQAENAALDESYKAQVAAAIKAGIDTTNITALYNKQKEDLEKKSTAAKLDLASGFAGNLANIFGKSTKVGKAAASASIAIDTVKGAMAAFTSMASIPIVGLPLGIAAAGAVVAQGAKAIKDVWATKSGLPGDSGGGGATAPSNPATGSVPIAPTAITGGLVSRQSGQVEQAATTQAVQSAMAAAPTRTVLVTNDLTVAQNERVALKTSNSL
jgi:hypothetical protein